MADQAEDHPWTESQWEVFLSRADFFSARYQELFETLADHPQRDRLIGREMGWDESDPAGTQPWLHEVEQEPGPADTPSLCDPGDGAARAINGMHTQFDDDDASLKAIPAYHHATAFADALRLAAMNVRQSPDGEPDDDLVQTLTYAMAIAPKLAAGHSMGYRDEVLGGNIVHCRRALDTAHACAASLDCLQAKGLFEAATLGRLQHQLAALRQSLDRRVRELRARVWW